MAPWADPAMLPLRQSLARLRALAVVPLAQLPLQRTSAAAGQALRQVVLDEVPAFTASANPQVLPQFEQHAGDHLDEIARLFGGGAVGQFDFVRIHAQGRAEQRFPLEALLHAYRCGHKVLSQWMRQAANAAVPNQLEAVVSAIADFAIEYTNATSTICTAEFVARTRTLAEAEGDRRTELLTILTSGYDESDARVARILKRAGYLDQRQSYCVAIVQSTDPIEMEHPARVQRIIDAIGTAVAPLAIRLLAGGRQQGVVAVLSDTRRISGWTAPRAALAARLFDALQLLGPSVLVGLSSDQPSTAFIPKAAQEAGVALDLASVKERVVSFASIPIRQLLLHRGADDVRAALPAWAAELRRADAAARGALVATLRALADASLNVQAAGRALAVHPNTLYARLQRITELTGLDARRYRDLETLLLGADCLAR